MPNLLSIPQSLAKGFITTVALLAAGIFSLEGWILAFVAFYVVRFVASLFVTISDQAVAGILLIFLWLAVSAGLHNPSNDNGSKQPEKQKRKMKLTDDGELEESDHL